MLSLQCCLNVAIVVVVGDDGMWTRSAGADDRRQRLAKGWANCGGCLKEGWGMKNGCLSVSQVETQMRVRCRRQGLACRQYPANRWTTGRAGMRCRINCNCCAHSLNLRRIGFVRQRMKRMMVVHWTLSMMMTIIMMKAHRMLVAENVLGRAHDAG